MDFRLFLVDLRLFLVDFRLFLVDLRLFLLDFRLFLVDFRRLSLGALRDLSAFVSLSPPLVHKVLQAQYLAVSLSLAVSHLCLALKLALAFGE